MAGLNPVNQGTLTNVGAAVLPEKDPKAECEAKGGFWDAVNGVCLLKKPEPEPKKDVKQVNIETGEVTTKTATGLNKGGQRVDASGRVYSANADPSRVGTGEPLIPETFRSPETGGTTGLVLPDGRTFLGATALDTQNILGRQQAQDARLAGTAPVGTSQGFIQQKQQQEALAGQVGQFDQLGLGDDPLFNIEQGIGQGIVDAIPSALRMGILGAGVGVSGGTALGTAAAPLTAGISIPAGALIGGAAGFVGGMASSMISEFKGQRSDTVTAQQRVLDEGKQTMKDWATLAEADPTNKARYLAEYNKVAAQIDQAYRQMKLDTTRDLTKFETALPNLAEFESFYAAGGEKATLDVEMANALTMPSTAEYAMLEMAYRRKQ